MKISPGIAFLILMSVLLISACCFSYGSGNTEQEQNDRNLRRWVCGNTHIQSYLNELTTRGAKVVEIKALTDPHGIYGFYDILVIYEEVVSE